MLAKSRLNSIKVLISKALIESNISHDKFVLINDGPKEYDEMKEELKHLNTKQFIEDFSLFIKECHRIVWSIERI